MAVKTLDAGGSLMLSGDVQAEVDAALARYVELGSKVVSQTGKIGSRWVASCTVPPRDPASQTTTLSLAAIQAAAARKKLPPPDPSDGCIVEELGYKRMITGPSQRRVQARVDYLMQSGAKLVSAAEQIDELWVAVVDTSGAENPGS